MRQPPPEAYPEYRIVNHPQGAREFRVETKSYFRSRHASALHYTGLVGYAPALIFPALGAVAWQMVCYASGMPTGLPTKTLLSLAVGP